jgi:uncharacterized membrane protein (UPF0127 family)
MAESVMTKFKAGVAALLVACGFLATAVAQDAPQPKLPTVQLQAGMHAIRAEVASTLSQQATGLMHRREMAQHEGMLFVYEEPGVHCFYMRNTLLPLSLAFIADDGTIVHIDDMKPLTLDSHCPPRPVRFVLEMNQGWFAKRNIRPGFRLSGPPFGK